MANEPTSKLDELLDALAEEIGDSKEKGRNAALKIHDRSDGLKAVAETFQKKYLGKRTAAESEKAGELGAQLKEATDALAEARQQIKELESKEPNWQRRLEDNDRKWQQKVEAAETKVQEERRIRLKDKVEIERQKFVAALRIGQEGGVDEDYGALLPAQYVSHFAPDEDNQGVKVLELGETNAFYDPAEGEPAEQLARDVLAKLPPKVRIMGDPEPGGGVGAGARVQNKAMASLLAAKRNDPLYGGGF